MNDLEQRVKACEGSAQQLATNALQDVLQQLEELLIENQLKTLETNEEFKAYSNQVKKLKEDLGNIRRTLQNLPAQVERNADIIVGLTQKYSTLEDRVDQKFAEYDEKFVRQNDLYSDMMRRVQSLEKSVHERSGDISPIEARTLLQQIHQQTPMLEATLVEEDWTLQDYRRRMEELECQVKALSMVPSATANATTVPTGTVTHTPTTSYTTNQFSPMLKQFELASTTTVPTGTVTHTPTTSYTTNQFSPMLKQFELASTTTVPTGTVTHTPTTSYTTNQFSPMLKQFELASDPNAATKLLGQLEDLANNNNDNCVAIAEAGGIDCVVSAMQRHAGHTAVQEAGCWALASLACNHDNCVAIAKAGGIDYVVFAMQRYASHAAVQEAGCWVLASLACNHDNKVAIALAGGIDRVVSAVQRYASHTGVQEQDCRALRNLADINNDNCVAIAGAGGIDRVVLAMRKHTKHSAVQEQGCWALASLACNHDNKVAIAEAEGINRVVFAMQQYASHTGVQEAGCWALASLAYNNDNKVAIALAGGIDRVVSAMQQHASHTGVQEQGCRALRNLADNNSDNVLRLRRRKALTVWCLPCNNMQATLVSKNAVAGKWIISPMEPPIEKSFETVVALMC